MTIQLKKGVFLTVEPTEKFKTIRILIRFQTMLNATTISKRSLLASLLETNSKLYDTQTKMSEELANLYGASFNTYVSRKGNHHWLNFSMNLINGSYINDETLLQSVVDFLKEVIFRPNVVNGAFEEVTFTREKENLKQYIDSMKEDKQYYASTKLNELYFDDAPLQSMASFGTIEAIEKETAQSVATYYQSLLAKDIVDIIVIGDVSEEEVIDMFDNLPFEDRADTKLPEIFFEAAPPKLIREKVEHEQIKQSKLNLGYYLPVDYGTKEYFPLLVFNGIFGGFSHSRLFMNIREKQSLAYYANSSFDTFRSLLTVQTGIDAKNREQVLHLIHQELESIRQGKIMDEELNQTKEMLKNSYLLSLDNSRVLMEQAFIHRILPRVFYTEKQWMELVEGVTKEDVRKIAQQIELAAVFFLEGTEN